jgi:hypothetical protein
MLMHTTINCIAANKPNERECNADDMSTTAPHARALLVTTRARKVQSVRCYKYIGMHANRRLKIYVTKLQLKRSQPE